MPFPSLGQSFPIDTAIDCVVVDHGRRTAYFGSIGGQRRCVRFAVADAAK